MQLLVLRFGSNQRTKNRHSGGFKNFRAKQEPLAAPRGLVRGFTIEGLNPLVFVVPSHGLTVAERSNTESKSGAKSGQFVTDAERGLVRMQRSLTYPLKSLVALHDSGFTLYKD